MEAPSVHRELLLPAPVPEPPETPPLTWTSPTRFWLEIHRDLSGRVRYALGSASTRDLESMMIYLENTRPRLAAGTALPCPAAEILKRGVFARAVAVQRHHHLPLELRPEADTAGFLLRTLGSRTFAGHDLVLQLLFQRTRIWEEGLFSPRFNLFAERQGRDLRAEMESRRAGPAFHVELRAHLRGPRPLEALTALGSWLEQWTTQGGVPWRSWQVIPRKLEQPFHAAFATHDILRFSNRRARRDVSATELSHLLSIPWAAHHAGCSYAGAPASRPGPASVIASSPPTQDRPLRRVDGSATVVRIAKTFEPRLPPAPDCRLVVGVSGPDRVALPKDWNHLAILGRTQSGKSTLALNLVLQILAKRPEATVVLIEPTGTLVEGVVSRIPLPIASDSVEIDPAHATFEQDGETMVPVPLGLLRAPDRASNDRSSTERWSEALAGDLLAAIRSAWGEESIGGRAELVLRALVQGLTLAPGSNLVDAYHILSSKQALQRFVATAPAGPLRNFLGHHLPRLDYNFTMSSLDKVGKIATNPLLRVALCQRANPVSFDRLLGHPLLLLNLSKSALGADGANFLGAIYLTQLWSALQRVGRPNRPVYLVLDEVHNYAVPALADMLSEGAKFGLHVVAITQFLHRVPPRARAALLGNADAWLLFSLGTDDMEDAWKIVNGAGHGWRPQDLVDGLRPHEVAMAVSGDLLKVGTFPAPRVDPCAKDLLAAVTQSSRRYAQPEDSEASPWLVGQEEVEGLLTPLPGRALDLQEVAQATALPPDQLAGALARATASGDVERGPDDGRLRLTPRGDVHLQALRGRRNEGEEHVETLTEFAMFLQTRGISMNVPEQVAGVLLPDGQFQWGATTYNVEVECSTLAKAAGQVVRNVKKARAAGRRVLIVLPERSRAPRALALIDEAFPGLQLWNDGVGLVWKEGRASFRSHRVPGMSVWPFLDSGASSVTSIEQERVVGPLPAATDTDPLVGQVRSIVREFVVAGKTETTPQEVLAALPPPEQLDHTEQQVGIALRTLGLERRRSRVEGTRFRVYDLRPLGPAGSGLAVRTGGGPASWIEPKSDPAGDPAASSDRAADSPIENDPADPNVPAVPDD
ncbi:MAG: hypothetical protein WB789_05710 [Thermoplasmata archaeon]